MQIKRSARWRSEEGREVKRMILKGKKVPRHEGSSRRSSTLSRALHGVLLIAAWLLFVHPEATAQTRLQDNPPLWDDTCVATLQNQSVQISPDGSFVLPNIPVDRGLYRVRITCNRAGTVVHGASTFFSLTDGTDGSVDIPS